MFGIKLYGSREYHPKKSCLDILGTYSSPWTLYRNPLRAPDGQWCCQSISRFENSGSFTVRFHYQLPLPAYRLPFPPRVHSPFNLPLALRLCRNRQPQGSLLFRLGFHRRTSLSKRSFHRWRSAPSWHNLPAFNPLLVPSTPSPRKSPFGAVPRLPTSYASTQS